MKENYFEKQNLKIETIKGFNGGEASYCPERGGIISSLKLNNKEILYLDEKTFQDTSINVKGGIPILFPNAGPLTENSEFPNLPQHGFARNSKWKTENVDDGFKETLITNEETALMYPYNFDFSISGKFTSDGSFLMNQEVENKEKEKELPLSFGFHPYFKVPGEEDSNTKKKNIKFNFEGGNLIEEQVETWANGKAISIDNPKVKNPEAIMEIEIPGLGTLSIEASPEYKKIWVWSMPEKDFICVEPVMRNKNGLINDPEKIKPKEKFSASIKFNLK